MVGTAIIELKASEAVDAKLVAVKERDDIKSSVLEEFDSAFSNDPTESSDRKMRFKTRASGLTEVALALQEHGERRRNRGELEAGKKYQSIGDKIKAQLLKQDAWVQ